MGIDESNRQHGWEHDGFFIVRRLVQPERIRELSAACDHALRQVRQDSTTQGHLGTHVSLAPDRFEQWPGALARLSDYMSSREVLTLIHDLGRPGEGLPNLRDAQYFHEPSARDYDGAWHRDGDGPGPSELAASARPTLLRFRLAFAPDDHLEYVPGSHRRADTPEERRVLKGAVRNAPLAAGPIRIELEPGEVCVFNTWGIHRGRYRHDRIRRTLDLLFGFGPRRRVDFGPLLALLAAKR